MAACPALAVLSLAFFAVGCAGVQAPVLERRDNFQRGVALGLFGNDEQLSAELASLDEIRSLGATHVSLVITWTQKDVRASTVETRPGYTVSRAPLVQLIRRARALGLEVMLFPIVRLIERTPAEWRGVIAPTDPARWFASYGSLVADLATLASEEHVAVLSIGSELVSLEHDVERWRALIAEARARFGGQLLYSANWDRFSNVLVWPELDLMGISAYWDLTPHGRRPMESEAIEAWTPILRAVSTFAASVHRPVVFTEFGYPSVAGGGASPWNDFLEGADGQVDGEAQRRLYEVFARVWGGQAALAGAYAWIWFGRGGPADRGYTPRRKPAELVLRTWYRDPRVLPPPR